MSNNIIRLPNVLASTGYSRSTIYMRITQGLWPKGISLGARAVGWRETEIATMNAALIAGNSDDELRKLVVKLESDRKHATGKP